MSKMTALDYSNGIRELTFAAMNSGNIDVAQIIGTLEIAKLNVDRAMVQLANQQQAKAIVSATPVDTKILDLNGHDGGRS